MAGAGEDKRSLVGGCCVGRKKTEVTQESTASLGLMLLKTLRKWLGRLLLVMVGAILLLYLVFLGLMTVTEQRWLGSPPFHPAIDVLSHEPHELTLIDGGVESLAARLEIIKQAEQSLDLEFFIYDLDAASRIVTRALVERAQAGVQVRVLVDFSLAVFQLRPQFARELAAAGVEVRYYNTSSVARFFSVQHRTHRKILLADAQAAMVGGRNIANDYFDLSPDYNFLDSDVVVRGPAVSDMQESFDLYWNSPWSTRWSEPEGTDESDVLPLLAPRQEDEAVVEALQKVAVDLPSHRCPNLRFVTDYPGVGLQNRRVFQAITEVLAEAKHQVTAESPYFVLRDDGVEVLRSITERGVQVNVLTNSLNSTDAYYTVSPLYFSLRSLALQNFNLYAYSGAAPKVNAAFPGSDRWGVHSKRAVVDEDTIMIGTYNIDPRSANLNSELMVVCQGNSELAAQMRQDLASRIERSELVVGDQAVESSHLIGDAPLSSLLMMGLVTPVASLFNFLL